jgi:hypothetical protein
VISPPVAVVWATSLLSKGRKARCETWALLAMCTGLASLNVAIAGVIGRKRNAGGRWVAPILLALLFLSTAFPPRWRPLPIGDVPGGWAPIYLRWSTAAAGGVLLFLWSSRDPAGTALRHRASRSLITWLREPTRT